eukprot:599474-Rhodomonas_salina.1
MSRAVGEGEESPPAPLYGQLRPGTKSTALTDVRIAYERIQHCMRKLKVQIQDTGINAFSGSYSIRQQ